MRIRTVKPDIMRHEDLSDLESANPGTFCFLTFIGLFMLSDKNGVFAWRLLHLDLWPLLDYDREKTLGLLEDAKLIRRFVVDGKQYGHVINFKKHQRINGKEAQEDSRMPDPPEGSNGEASEKHLGSTKMPSGNGNGNGNDICRAAIEYLNLRTGREFDCKAKDAREFVHARVSEAHTLDDFKAVIDFKVSEWRGDSKMKKFLRPSTLFRPKFSEYLAEARAAGKPIPTVKVAGDFAGKHPCDLCGAECERKAGYYYCPNPEHGQRDGVL